MRSSSSWGSREFAIKRTKEWKGKEGKQAFAAAQRGGGSAVASGRGSQGGMADLTYLAENRHRRK